MKDSNPKIIILLGRSGSGKGTQAKILVEKFALDYVGSGDLLRERQKEGDFTGRKLKEVLGRGGFAPTAIIFGLWLNKWEGLKSKPEFNGFVIDGSPRKLLEAELIDQTLGWYEWDKHLSILLVEISREEAFNRLSKRRICKECGKLIPWVGKFKELDICDECGGGLQARADDIPDAINSRLDLFEKEVVPAIDYYKKSDRLIRINGEQSIEDVHKDIMEAIGK